MCPFNKGDVLIITRSLDKDYWLQEGEIVTFLRENSIIYVVNKDGQELAAAKTQCELLSDYRKRVIDAIIND